MIENYFAFALALKISRKQSVFMFLSISALLDLICYVVTYLNKWIEFVNVGWMKWLAVLAIMLFFAFAYGCAVSKKDNLKLKRIYLPILVIFCIASIVLLAIWMHNNNERMLKILRIVYGFYTFMRLIFVLHIRYKMTRSQEKNLVV